MTDTTMQHQLDAAKQMYNDMSNTCLQLRTSLNAMNKQLLDQGQTINTLNDQIKSLNEEIDKLKVSQPESDQPENS